MISQDPSQREEEYFKKSPNICFSPKGHIYQVSYATLASKNSKGVVFLRTKTGVLIFRAKGSEDFLSENVYHSDPYQELMEDIFLDSENKVLIYFLGHKYNVEVMKLDIKRALNQRSQLVLPNFPGLEGYLIKYFCGVNSYQISRNKISGLTYCGYTQDVNSKLNGFVVKPNNKILRSGAIIEGGILKQEVLDLLAHLNNANVFGTKIDLVTLHTDPQVRIKDFKALKKQGVLNTYDVFHVDLQTGNVESVF